MRSNSRRWPGFLLPVILAAASTASAHPAVGIVVDRNGAVFYSDNARVWRIGRDGRMDVAVPGVHTHELWLDTDGTLYGEHLWYEGEATDKWGHRIWKRAPDGRVSEVIAARRGFREDYRDFFFARDARGAMYWIERAAPAPVCVRTPGGPVRTIATLTLAAPEWTSVSPAGIVFIVEKGRVFRVAENEPTRELPRVTARRGRYSVMSVATDARGAVYVAAFDDRQVRRIGVDGAVTTVATSPRLWGPTGLALASDGTLWVLEASVFNAQRVRRVAPDGAVRVFTGGSQ
jgi:hypothetical protein